MQGFLLVEKEECFAYNEYMKWTIQHIFDGEYGCEALAPGEKPKLSVTLVNESGEERREAVEDDWLRKRKLDVGSVWPETSEEEHEEIRRLAAECGYPYELLIELYEGGELPIMKP